MRKFLLPSFCIICLMMIKLSLSSYSTGATGQSTAGCTCHNPTATTATVVSTSGFPTNYVNGQAYSITFTITNTSKVAGGFDLVVSAGTLSGAISGQTAITGTSKEIYHTSPKNMTAGTVSWNFTWTAPTTGTAAVNVTYAGNAVNLLNGSAGDAWNTGTKSVGGPVTPLSVTASSGTIFCNGGAATIGCTGAGGATPYQYKLNAGAYQTTTTFAGNVAGTYTITIKDANNTTASTIKTITQPSAVSILSSSTNISCFGGSNGAAQVTVSGGTPGYTYSWSPSGGANSIASGLSAGNYTCTVTDANSCTKTQTFTITQPTSLAITPAQNNILCFGLTGTASVSVSGGIPSYTYSWAPSGGTAATATGLAAGTYTCTVTDANSCNKTQTFTFTQPTVLTLTPTPSNVSCFGGNNGSASMSVSGGNTPYSYSWAPFGGSANIASNLTSGTYTCTVTDNNNCISTQTVSISQPPLVDVIANASSSVVCNGSVVTLYGSNSASSSSYTYTWSGGVSNNTPFISNSTTTYTVTGTSSVTGCSDQGTITVIPAGSNALALSASSNSISVPNSICATVYQIPGAIEKHTTSACELIATLEQLSSSPNLGNVTSCVQVLNTVPTFNGQPYAPRFYTITPQNQGQANVTLYFTHGDLVSYNNYVISNNSSFPLFNLPSGTPTNGAVVTNVSITKIEGTLGAAGGTAFPVTLTYDASLPAWKTTFTVSSFSSFYLHATNPNNTPLSVDLISFSGIEKNKQHSLQWQVAREVEIKSYQVEYSTDGLHFYSIGEVQALSNTGVESQYIFSNAAIQPGHNYYRLKSIETNGHTQIISKTLDLINGNGLAQSNLMIYPNPTQNKELSFTYHASSKIKMQLSVCDVTGKILWSEQKWMDEGLNSGAINLNQFQSGLYWLKISDSKNNVITKPFQLR